MSRLLPAFLTASVLALPAAAGEGEGAMRDGFSLLQEGTRLMLRGLMEELEPALRDLQDRVGDLSAYHPPEILPNGDIIIRRKIPLDPGETPEAAPGEEIEL